MLEMLDNVVFSNDDIDLDFVTLLSSVNINTRHLNSINLDDNADDLETMIHDRFVACCNEYKQVQHLNRVDITDIVSVKIYIYKLSIIKWCCGLTNKKSNWQHWNY